MAAAAGIPRPLSAILGVVAQLDFSANATLSSLCPLLSLFMMLRAKGGYVYAGWLFGEPAFPSPQTSATAKPDNCGESKSHHVTRYLSLLRLFRFLRLLRCL